MQTWQEIPIIILTLACSLSAQIKVLDASDYSKPTGKPGEFLVSNLPADLARPGTTRDGVAADGVARLLLRVKVLVPGSATFKISSATGKSLGWLENPLNRNSLPGRSQSIKTTSVKGVHYAFCVYRAPLDFVNSAADITKAIRDIVVQVTVP